MFKNEGRKAFDACDVKRVEFKTFVWDIDEQKKTTNQRVLSVNPSEDARTSAGHGAVLHCPRTEDDKVFVQSDVTNIPLFVRNPGFHLMFDQDPQVAEATRIMMFGMAPR